MTDKTPQTEAPAAPAPVVKAKSAGERKGKQLSATVSEEFFAAFTDLKWDIRKEVPEMVREAAEDYFAKHSPKAPGAEATAAK